METEVKIKNFEAFKETGAKTSLGDWAELFGDCAEDYEEAVEYFIVYDNSLWIAVQHDGNYWLLLENGDWTESELATQEKRLYDFYVTCNDF